MDTPLLGERRFSWEIALPVGTVAAEIVVNGVVYIACRAPEALCTENLSSVLLLNVLIGTIGLAGTWWVARRRSLRGRVME